MTYADNNTYLDCKAIYYSLDGQEYIYGPNLLKSEASDPYGTWYGRYVQIDYPDELVWTIKTVDGMKELDTVSENYHEMLVEHCKLAIERVDPQWTFTITEDCPSCADDTLTIDPDEKYIKPDEINLTHFYDRGVDTLL